MTTESKSRWWEDYLVRYLTPMLVGSLLVLVVGVYIGYPKGIAAFFSSDLLWNEKKEANVSALIGILIAGFAYTYLCSTPITVFHAGRMIRNGLNTYATFFWYSWFVTCLICILGLVVDGLIGIKFLSPYRTDVLLVIAGLPAIWMFFGQYDVIWRLKVDKEQKKSVFVEHYDRLAAARGQDKWSMELRESYTHLREHANSVFICVAEISVAALVVFAWRFTGGGSMFVLLCLLGLMVWIAPNVFLWSIANRLEKHLIGTTDEEKS